MITVTLLIITTIFLAICLHAYFQYKLEIYQEIGNLSKRLKIIYNFYIVFFVLLFLANFIGMRHMWIYSKFSDHSRTISIAIFLFFISIVIALSIISMRLMFRYLQSYKFNQRDDLTTLYTKMTGLSKIGQILVESNKSLYVAMLDIDNFKMVNDIYGHLEGDELLKKISVIIREATKDKDVLCRFGGDEFVICLVSETEQSALEVFSNILKKWSGLSENYSKVDMGVSIGYCEGCRSKGNGSSTAKSIIKKADIALYKVKQNGKKGIYQYKEEYIKSNTI